MQVIPLKKKYSFTEDDINNLSKMIAENRTLEDISYIFEGRMSPEQAFIVVGVIVKEMYNSSIEEMCPHIIEERSKMNHKNRKKWEKENENSALLSSLKSIAEDLYMYESELSNEASRLKQGQA